MENYDFDLFNFTQLIPNFLPNAALATVAIILFKYNYSFVDFS